MGDTRAVFGLFHHPPGPTGPGRACAGNRAFAAPADVLRERRRREEHHGGPGLARGGMPGVFFPGNLRLFQEVFGFRPFTSCA
jgi:hypothetical protein